MKSPQITLSEWQSAMDMAGAVVPPPENSWTVSQLASALQCGTTTVKVRLRKLIAEGRCKKVMARVKGCGGIKITPYYTLVPATKPRSQNCRHNFQVSSLLDTVEVCTKCGVRQPC